MQIAVINRDMCKKEICGLCRELCAFIYFDVDNKTPLIQQACVACNICVEACPVGAITLEVKDK